MNNKLHNLSTRSLFLNGTRLRLYSLKNKCVHVVVLLIMYLKMRQIVAINNKKQKQPNIYSILNNSNYIYDVYLDVYNKLILLHIIFILSLNNITIQLIPNVLILLKMFVGLMCDLAPANSKKDTTKRKLWKKYNTYYDESTIKVYESHFKTIKENIILDYMKSRNPEN